MPLSTHEDLAAIDLLLARIFLKEVDAELLHALRQPRIAEVLEKLEPGFAAYVNEAPWDATSFDEAAADYAALFLLPQGVSPYAASWTEGEEGIVRSQLGDEISQIYDALHIEATDFGLGNVPSDHIGMLLSLTSVARQRQASGELAQKSQALFADWGPRFGARILKKSQSPLYRAAAHLLLEVLARPLED